MQYFQYSKTAAERQIHALTLFHLFVMVLDVVSEFFAELSPRTFGTFRREFSSPRDRLTSADAAMSSRC